MSFVHLKMAVIGRKLKTHLHTNILILQTQTFKSYWTKYKIESVWKTYNILRTISVTYLKNVCNICMFDMDNCASPSLFSQIHSYSTGLSQKSCTTHVLSQEKVDQNCCQSYKMKCAEQISSDLLCKNVFQVILSNLGFFFHLTLTLPKCCRIKCVARHNVVNHF